MINFPISFLEISDVKKKKLKKKSYVKEEKLKKKVMNKKKILKYVGRYLQDISIFEHTHDEMKEEKF